MPKRFVSYGNEAQRTQELNANLEILDKRVTKLEDTTVSPGQRIPAVEWEQSVTFKRPTKVRAGNSRGTAGTFQDDFIIESNTDAGMTVLVPDDSFATYGFAGPSDSYLGGMFFRHSDAEMTAGPSMVGADFRLLSGNSVVTLVLFSDQGVGLRDGITAPSAKVGFAQLYVDSADGDLKIRFGDGTIKTIVTDT